MSEEEKKAIEKLKELIEHKDDVDLFYGYKIQRPYPIGKNGLEEIEPILNLIEKLQKEIEELKKYETYYKEQNEVNKKFISKQKIKQKIKEMKEANNYLYRMGINRTTEEDFTLKSIIETLEELLEEED